MENEEKRLYIAKFLNDPIKKTHECDSRDEGRYYECWNCNQTWCWNEEIIGQCPGTDRDYPNSLEAMRYAEFQLDESQRDVYVNELIEIVYKNDYNCDLFELINASPKQKSTALVNCIKRWNKE